MNPLAKQEQSLIIASIPISCHHQKNRIKCDQKDVISEIKMPWKNTKRKEMHYLPLHFSLNDTFLIPTPLSTKHSWNRRAAQI
jgi:hypothetical protein